MRLQLANLRLAALLLVLGVTCYFAFVTEPVGGQPAVAIGGRGRPMPTPTPASAAIAVTTPPLPRAAWPMPPETRGEEVEVLAALIPRRSDTPRPTGLASAPPGANVDLFSHRDWTPPPPPPPPPLVMAPAAPPMPFVYAGRKQDDGRWEVYIMRGDTVHVVQEGSVVENTYKVMAIKPPAMTLRYMPLGIDQKLAIGEAD